jgi:hypothetical protein
VCSSWLQVQRSGFDSWRYQIFWEVVGLEWGPLSLVSTTEELLGRNSSGFGLENREYGRGNPLHWPRDTLYPQKLALTSPTSGDCSVGIVRLRTKAMEFFFVCVYVRARRFALLSQYVIKFLICTELNASQNNVTDPAELAILRNWETSPSSLYTFTTILNKTLFTITSLLKSKNSKLKIKIKNRYMFRPYSTILRQLSNLSNCHIVFSM